LTSNTSLDSYTSSVTLLESSLTTADHRSNRSFRSKVPHHQTVFLNFIRFVASTLQRFDRTRPRATAVVYHLSILRALGHRKSSSSSVLAHTTSSRSKW